MCREYAVYIQNVLSVQKTWLYLAKQRNLGATKESGMLLLTPTMQLMDTEILILNKDHVPTLQHMPMESGLAGLLHNRPHHHHKQRGLLCRPDQQGRDSCWQLVKGRWCFKPTGSNGHQFNCGTHDVRIS
ncbi:hypothetical protein ATANTOWER_017828 [Ataeniobius toweri]|uniref:Uncharacterized protein n=1 Tax=Ataeniobius toweri TaxID=208326 RepID=A0ABU7BQA7_9TELE|nr:hypothetical protein [Ataeniobius toweri]